MKWPFSIIQMENLHKQPRKWCLPSGERKVKSKTTRARHFHCFISLKFRTNVRKTEKKTIHKIESRENSYRGAVKANEPLRHTSLSIYASTSKLLQLGLTFIVSFCVIN